VTIFGNTGTQFRRVPVLLTTEGYSLAYDKHTDVVDELDQHLSCWSSDYGIINQLVGATL